MEPEATTIEAAGQPTPPPAQRVTKVISFASGKGGVGKTVIVSNLGHLLALMGHKVLLVDMDFFTHGLTFYLARGQKREECGVLDLLDSSTPGTTTPFERGDFHSIAPNLWLLPPVRKPLQTAAPPAGAHGGLLVLLGRLRRSDFDFILLDQRSGTDDFTLAAIAWSDSYVLVTEEDRTSQRASRFLIDAINDHHSSCPTCFREGSTVMAGFVVNMYTTAFPADLLAFMEDSVFNSPCLCMIPLLPSVRRVFVRDAVLVAESPSHVFSRAVRHLALQLTDDPHRGTTKQLVRSFARRTRIQELLPMAAAAFLVGLVTAALGMLFASKSVFQFPYVIITAAAILVTSIQFIVWNSRRRE